MDEIKKRIVKVAEKETRWEPYAKGYKVETGDGTLYVVPSLVPCQVEVALRDSAGKPLISFGYPSYLLKMVEANYTKARENFQTEAASAALDALERV